MIHSCSRFRSRGQLVPMLSGGISSLDDVELGVIAEGERAERIKNEGCLINDKVYHPQVWTPKEAKKADLLVVALKYNALFTCPAFYQRGSRRKHGCHEFNEWCRQRGNYCKGSGNFPSFYIL